MQLKKFESLIFKKACKHFELQMNYFKLSLILMCVSSIKGQDRNESSTIDVQSIQESKLNEKILSRKKRYLIFPTGSSFSVAVCSTIGIYGNPQFSIFRWDF